MTFALMSATNPALLAASGRANTPIITEIGGLRFVELQGGPFVMGSSMVGLPRVSCMFEDASPYWVNLSPFAMGETVVSAKQYRSQVQTDKNRIKDLPDDHPVTFVSWHDACNFAM